MFCVRAALTIINGACPAPRQLASPVKPRPGKMAGMAVNRGNGGGFGSFVAMGDSFTEGLSDLRADGSMRGWADRFAERAAGSRPGFRYANLAVRAKVVREVADEQVPALSRCARIWSAWQRAATTCSGCAPTRTR